MLCGLVVGEPRTFTFTLTASGSTSGSSPTAPLGWSGNMVVYYAIDFVAMPIGISMETTQEDGGLSPGGGGSFYSDLFSASASQSFPGGGAPTCTFVWSDVSLYMDSSGTWFIDHTGAVATIGGVTVFSTGAGRITCPRQPCPASIPGLGIYAQVGAAAVVPQIPTTSTSGGFAPAIPSVSYSGTADSTGTWSFTGTSGSATISASGHAEATTTADAVTAVNYSEQEWNWAVPGWARSVVRMENDSLALVFRWDLPEILQADTDETQDYSGGLPAVVTGGTTYTTVNGGLTQFLEIVGDGTATIEAPFAGAPTPFLRLATTQTISNPNGLVTHIVGSRIAGDDCVVPGQCAAYLDHGYWGFRYFNTWLHPHWSFGLPVFGDTGQWAYPGGDDAYWRPEKQQWMVHPSLPSTDPNLGLRNFVVSDPFDQNGIVGFTQGAIGTDNFWGTSHFDAMLLTGPSSFLMDASTASRWTWAGDGSIGSTGTGTVGATVVTITSGTTVDLSMGDWAVWPYMCLHRCNQLTLPAITDANVSKVEAFLIGADGGAVSVGSVSTGDPLTTFTIPRGPGVKSGGSWGHEAGGTALSDTFSMAPGSDISPAVAADPELAGCYPFVPFGSGARMRFVLTPVGSGSVSMHQPTFLAAGTPKSFADVSSCRSILFPDGPMIRYGIEDHYDPLADDATNPPTGMPTYDRMREAGDAYVWRRLWWDAIAWNSGLVTELTAKYVFNVEWTVVKHFWRDPDLQRVTHSFVAKGDDGPVLCAVNSYRGSVPPLGYFPQKERTSATNWAPSGADFVQYSYCLTPSRRPHITVNAPTLEKPIGTDLLTITETAPSGWDVRSHRLAVTGLEGYDYAAVTSAKTWAKVRDWRGFVWWEGLSSGGVHLSVDFVKGFILQIHNSGAMVESAAFRIGGASFSGSVAVGIRAQGWTKADGSFGAAYERGGTVYASYSYDVGQTWSGEEVIGTGTLPAPCQEFQTTGWDFCAIWNSGDYHLYSKERKADPSLETWVDQGLIITAPEVPAGLVSSSTEDGAIVFAYTDGSGIHRLATYNYGLNWETLT